MSDETTKPVDAPTCDCKPRPCFVFADYTHNYPMDYCGRCGRDLDEAQKEAARHEC